MKESSSEKKLSQKHIKSNDGRMEGHTKSSSISLSQKQHDGYKNARSSRFLITINVFGSAGPLRFVVSEDDIVAKVIETALKQYARVGRLPVLGTDFRPFFLYTVDNGFNGMRLIKSFNLHIQNILTRIKLRIWSVEALKSWEAIGSCGLRNFVLCKQMTDSRPHRKGSGWRACFQKVLI